MPPLTDSDILAQLARAFEYRSYAGEVLWTDKAIEEMQRDHPRENIADGYSALINDAVHEHIVSGGRIQQVKETGEDRTGRHNYRENRYFYEFQVLVESIEVYVKVVIQEENDPESQVAVVSCHYGWS